LTRRCTRPRPSASLQRRFEPFLLQDCHKTGGFGWNSPPDVALGKTLLRMSISETGIDFSGDMLMRRLLMHRVSNTDMRRGTEWLTGLVRTMDAVTRDAVCIPGDPVLNARFAAYLRQSKPIARIPIMPDPDEPLAPPREAVRN
jgi:hypothetical protein